MPVLDQATSNSFTGNGVTTAFAYTFKLIAEGDILVEVDGVAQTLTTHYTVSGVGNSGGGTVTFVTAPASGAAVELSRDMAFERATDYQDNGDLLASTLEEDLDRAVMLAQQVRDQNNAGGYNFIQAGSGTVTRTAQNKLRESVSVLDFGAVGDGTTDDTVAIQAAITYCQDNLKALRFPANDPSQYYKITDTLTISKPINVIGDGSHSVTIIASGLAVGEYALDVDGTAYGTFEKMNLSGISIRAGAGDCIRLKNVSLSKLSDIGVGYCRHGITYTGTRAFSNRFERLHSNGSITGSGFLMTSHTGGGHHSFHDCTFGGAYGVNIQASVAVDNVAFNSCNFEQCTTNSFSIDGTIDALAFFGCRTEGCDAIDFRINPDTGCEVKGLVIAGCVFGSSDAGGSTRISIGGDPGVVRGFSITGNVVTHGANIFSAAFVTLNGDGESGMITGNFLNGTDASGAVIVSAARAGVLIYGNENLTGKLPDYGSGNAIATSFWNCVEGTLTLTDGSGAGLVFTGVAGHYTRIGRMAFWQATLTYPATADASAAELAGLPYTPLNNSSSGRSGAVVNATDAGIDLGILQSLTSAAELKLYNRQTLAAVTNAQLSGKVLYLSGFFAV